jgi:hypothetical protein
VLKGARAPRHVVPSVQTGLTTNGRGATMVLIRRQVSPWRRPRVIRNNTTLAAAEPHDEPNGFFERKTIRRLHTARISQTSRNSSPNQRPELSRTRPYQFGASILNGYVV